MKRVLQLSVVKKDPKTPVDVISDSEVKSIEFTVETISRAVDRSIKTIGVATIGYVVLDTLRQVLVANATKQ